MDNLFNKGDFLPSMKKVIRKYKTVFVYFLVYKLAKFKYFALGVIVNSIILSFTISPS